MLLYYYIDILLLLLLLNLKRHVIFFIQAHCFMNIIASIVRQSVNIFNSLHSYRIYVINNRLFSTVSQSFFY